MFNVPVHLSPPVTTNLLSMFAMVFLLIAGAILAQILRTYLSVVWQLMLAVCWDRSWDCSPNTYTKPLHVTWYSSQHGQTPGASILKEREPGRNCIIFSNLALEVKIIHQHSVLCSLAMNH